jgi:hypothetical protein
MTYAHEDTGEDDTPMAQTATINTTDRIKPDTRIQHI